MRGSYHKLNLFSVCRQIVLFIGTVVLYMHKLSIFHPSLGKEYPLVPRNSTLTLQHYASYVVNSVSTPGKISANVFRPHWRQILISFFSCHSYLNSVYNRKAYKRPENYPFRTKSGSPLLILNRVVTKTPLNNLLCASHFAKDKGTPNTFLLTCFCFPVESLMNILKGLGKLIFSLDLKVNYLFFLVVRKNVTVRS